MVAEDPTGQDASGNLFVYDLGSGVEEQFTFSGRDTSPAWNPDGSRIAFFSTRDGGRGVYVKPVQARGGETRQTEQPPDGMGGPSDWLVNDDGETLVGVMGPIPPGIGIFPIGSDAPSRRLSRDGRFEIGGRVSPNGRWIAYFENTGGEIGGTDFRVLVSPFPEMIAGSERLIGRGVSPVWSRDGTELFFNAFGDISAVSVEAEESFERGEVRSLFRMPHLATAEFDLAPDGRFLMLLPDGDAPPGSVTVVQDWFEELRRLVPVD